MPLEEELLSMAMVQDVDYQAKKWFRVWLGKAIIWSMNHYKRKHSKKGTVKKGNVWVARE